MARTHAGGDFDCRYYGRSVLRHRGSGGCCHLKDTGIGQKIDVAMLDCQLAILENAIARYMVTGVSPKPQGNRHPSIVPIETFDTADGVIMISVGNDNLWAKFCRRSEKKSIIDDERFDRNPKRFDNYKILRPLMAEVLMTKTTAQWQKIFDGIGVPNGRSTALKWA
jgi:CoA:oxalate CoA-transferase